MENVGKYKWNGTLDIFVSLVLLSFVFFKLDALGEIELVLSYAFMSIGIVLLMLYVLLKRL